MCWGAQRPMARWAEDGSVAKPRGGKGGTFVRCLTSKQIEVRASESSPYHHLLSTTKRALLDKTSPGLGLVVVG